MPIRCPRCGMKHDVAELEEDLVCKCGYLLNISLIESAEDFLRYCESEDERKKAKEIQVDAQVICQMILDRSYQDVDIEIAKSRLKEKVKKLFPEKMDTYRMIYEARFNRLWDQFRS